MTRRRWIADEVQEKTAALLGEHALHLSRVLRAQVGQEFDIVTPAGVHRGKIVTLSETRVEFELGQSLPEARLPEITLLLALFKFDRMEWAIEKVTELGVARIVPLIAARTEKHLAAAAEKRANRWRRIAAQASEQARRSTVPEIADPMKIDQAVKYGATTRLLLSESEKQRRLAEALPRRADGPVALAVGPEGGWTDAEHAQFLAAGWTPVSLGSTILRAETAAIAAIAVVMAELQ